MRKQIISPTPADVFPDVIQNRIDNASEDSIVGLSYGRVRAVRLFPGMLLEQQPDARVILLRGAPNVVSEIPNEDQPTASDTNAEEVQEAVNEELQPSYASGIALPNITIGTLQGTTLVHARDGQLWSRFDSGHEDDYEGFHQIGTVIPSAREYGEPMSDAQGWQLIQWLQGASEQPQSSNQG